MDGSQQDSFREDEVRPGETCVHPGPCSLGQMRVWDRGRGRLGLPTSLEDFVLFVPPKAGVSRCPRVHSGSRRPTPETI